MLLWATFDQDSAIVRVKILDSTVSTGAGKTGLTEASAGLIVSTIADSEAAATVYTQAAGNIETITTLGTYAAPTASKCRFKEVSAANHPGVYELQFANARFSIAGSKSLLVSIHGATGAAQCDAVIPLPTVDLFNPTGGVPFGGTALAKFIGGTPVALNGTTWVTAVAAPAATKQREVLSALVWNRDTVSHTIKQRKLVGATGYETGPPLVLAAGARGQLISGPIVLDATDMSYEISTDAAATTTEPQIDVSVFEVI